MNKIAGNHLGPKVKVAPKIVVGQPLEKFAQGAGQASQPGGTLAVGKQQRTIAVTDVN
ncbi:hypothetical protein GALL_521530 [mine drainage metagenome]|uniref:Uncharacterized protein n=1 Tax=mine drainage metagenome TaxID=410659 RepID=A0A1J5P530_9ZZZZ